MRSESTFDDCKSEPCSATQAGSFAVATAVLVLATCAAVRAQTGAGSLSGLVTDPTGSVMAEVEIAVECPDIGLQRTTRSDSGGRYSFPQLPPG